MYRNVAAGISTLAITGVLVSSAVAQADPATPMSVIEESAVQLCASVDRSPDADGVIEGIGAVAVGQGLDEIDGALILLVAVHHACPQHEDLLMGVMEPIAADELCGRTANDVHGI